MHEVAEAASSAFAHFVLTTAGLAEVGDGGQLGVNRQAVVPTIVEIRHRFSSVLFLAEFDVNVADLKNQSWYNILRLELGL